MFDEIEPIAFMYGAVGVLVGVIMMKFGNLEINILWKVLTVIVCGLGAFVLGQIQSGD